MQSSFFFGVETERKEASQPTGVMRTNVDMCCSRFIFMYLYIYATTQNDENEPWMYLLEAGSDIFLGLN